MKKIRKYLWKLLKMLHGFNTAGIETSKYPEAVLRDHNVTTFYSKKSASLTGYCF